MNYTELTFHQILKMLENKTPFVFMRYGDGEIRCINRVNGVNCDKHQFFPDMAEALHNVLAFQNLCKQTYYIGLQRLGDSLYPDFKSRYKIQWCDADILHQASITGHLHELFPYIRENTMMVGPKHLMNLSIKQTIQLGSIVFVPDRNCWKLFNDIFINIRETLINESHIDTIFFSCSMMAEPLMHRVHQEFPHVTLIDAGSVFDPYCGVNSRTYHQKIIDKHL